jgi:perosamine synthetase
MADLRPLEKLAIAGGQKLRTEPMPPRMALGEDEHKLIQECLAYYRDQKLDPGYQGPFEKRYTDAFIAMMGGGHADAVATGTAALYVALAALDLPKGSEVLVSPITDPGTLSAIILNGLKPRLMDSAPGSYNVDRVRFAERIGPDVTGAVIVHSIGQAADIEGIIAEARRHGIKVLEDCSQSHGARTASGGPVGSFGDIAAFSTMYRKAHVTGASGGLVYSRDLDLFHRALAFADRGKPRWLPSFDDRDPASFLFPALNLHSDEISCAVGIASLGRLEETIRRRLAFVREFAERMANSGAVACRPYSWSERDSPFIFPVVVDPGALRCSKSEFANAVLGEGIGLNPHYRYVVADWPWVKPYLADGRDTPNARAVRDRTFNLYLNENYGSREAADVVAAILKVEHNFAARPGHRNFAAVGSITPKDL